MLRGRCRLKPDAGVTEWLGVTSPELRQKLDAKVTGREMKRLMAKSLAG